MLDSPSDEVRKSRSPRIALILMVSAVVTAIGVWYFKLKSEGRFVNPIGAYAAQVRDDNGLKMKLVWCPPGEFMMGSPAGEIERSSGEDQFRVKLTEGFWMGQFEVTQQQYERLMGTNPSTFLANGSSRNQNLVGQTTAQFPVENVSWDDAHEFCRKLTEQERAAGRLRPDWKYTLPTEAQWEYACRAGTTSPYSFGSALNGAEANCDGNIPYGTTKVGKCYDRPIKVGSYSANNWGLYDMHGNVREWCQDQYQDKLPEGSEPQVSEGSLRVVRGGGWIDFASRCRSAYRNWDEAGDRYFFLGFRVVCCSVK